MTEYRISTLDGFETTAHHVDDDRAREWARGHLSAARPRVMLDRRADDDPATYPWDSLGVVRLLRLA